MRPVDNTQTSGSGLSFTFGVANKPQPWIAPPKRYDPNLDCFFDAPAPKRKSTESNHCCECGRSETEIERDNLFERFCAWFGSLFD